MVLDEIKKKSLKKILLMSDTHGHLDPEKINHVNWADECLAVR